jgi:para-aminobenzoate synthetase component 1
MEIIEELEPVRRGVYTGAIGWVDGQGSAEWSIAIRTMVLKEGRAYFHVGGGIVADSDPRAEWEETLAKAQGMLRALAPDAA